MFNAFHTSLTYVSLILLHCVHSSPSSISSPLGPKTMMDSCLSTLKTAITTMTLTLMTTILTTTMTTTTTIYHLLREIGEVSPHSSLDMLSLMDSVWKNGPGFQKWSVILSGGPTWSSASYIHQTKGSKSSRKWFKIGTRVNCSELLTLLSLWCLTWKSGTITQCQNSMKLHICHDQRSSGSLTSVYNQQWYAGAPYTHGNR